MTDEAALEARGKVLRRLVYGTPGGHESDAATELVEVERALAELRAAPAVVAEGAPAARTEPGGHAVDDPPDPAKRPRRTRRLVTAGAAAMAVVAAALALGPVLDLLDPPRGLEIFDRERDEADAGPRGFEAALGERAVTTLRHVGRAVGYDVWVFRDAGDVCMVAQRDPRSGWGANCVTESDFRRRGIRQFITPDELGGGARQAGLDPGSVVELAWNDRSAEIDWSIMPISEASDDDDRIWVPTFAEGAAPMTYEEWTSARLAARPGGS